MNKKIKILVFFAVVILAASLFFLRQEPAKAEVEEFAGCLADKNMVMYGADWCPHCQKEKALFGESFSKVPYVECPQDPQRCVSAGIEVYPTWILADGRKLEGEQGLEKLSRESGCELKTYKN